MVLGRRALNRAMLERQLLLRRDADMSAAAAVEMDGEVRGWWKIDRKAGTLTVELLDPLAPPEVEAVKREGLDLLAFAVPDGERRDIRVILGNRG